MSNNDGFLRLLKAILRKSIIDIYIYTFYLQSEVTSV